jgi:hypothetical protein
MATIHFNRSPNENAIREKMQAASAKFPQERREFLWVRVFELGLDCILKFTIADPAIERAETNPPAGRILEVPNNQAAEVPPLGGKPKTSEKPSCPKKPNQAKAKKLIPRRR